MIMYKMTQSYTPNWCRLHYNWVYMVYTSSIDAAPSIEAALIIIRLSIIILYKLIIVKAIVYKPHSNRIINSF